MKDKSKTDGASIIKVEGCCPSCSAGRAKKISRTHLECTNCGFTAPRETFNSLLEYCNWRSGFESGGSHLKSKEEAIALIRSIYESHLKDLEA